MCSEYWPNEGESVKHGTYTIKTLSERPFEDYVQREIEVTDESVSGENGGVCVCVGGCVGVDRWMCGWIFEPVCILCVWLRCTTTPGPLPSAAGHTRHTHHDPVSLPGLARKGISLLRCRND